MRLATSGTAFALWLATVAAGCASAGGGHAGVDGSVGGQVDAPGVQSDAPGATPDAPTTTGADASIPPDAPTFTADAAVDATPGCTNTVMQLLLNASFDSGATSWVESGAGYPIILSPSDPTYPLPITPHSGNYSAWLGGVDSATRVVYQDVAIPAGTTTVTLSGYRDIETEESGSTDYDTSAITVRSTGNTVLETAATWGNSDAVSSWTAWSKTLTGNYAGQTIRIHLQSINDSTLNTNFFYDTVALRATVCQ